MKITKDTPIIDYLSDKNVYGSQPEFKMIPDDYTFGEFWEDMKDGPDNIRINTDDDETLRLLLLKIQYVSGSKFGWTERKFTEALPLRLVSHDDFLRKILNYLTDEKNYCIYAHDTHRWISTDGWYELEYNLQDDNGTDVYLTTYNSHDQDFEDEWTSEDGHHVTAGELYMNSWSDDPLWIMSNLAGNDKVRNDIRPDLLNEMMRRLKNRFPDNY